MLVHDLKALTSARLAVVDHMANIRTAALALTRPGIGLVVVCNGAGNAQGVLSKSDLIRHLTSPDRSVPPAAALMTRSMVSCAPGDDLHDVWRTMSTRNLQNIPVLDAGTRPTGILDIRDAMNALFRQEEQLETMLSNYVAGVGYR